MIYDLEGFGNKIKVIRKKLKISQQDVKRIVGLNEDTIRKLEKGMTVPKVETLDLLSIAYNQDIYQLFSNYKITFDTYFEKRLESIVPLIRDMNLDEIDKEADKFYDYFMQSDYKDIEYLSRKMHQYHLYLLTINKLDSAIKDKSRSALTTLIKSLRVSSSDVEKDQVNDLDKLEIRTFILISTIYRYMDDFTLSMKYINAAKKSVLSKYSVDKDYLYFYLLLNFNLMTIYHRIDDYKNIDVIYKETLSTFEARIGVTNLAGFLIRAGLNKYYLDEDLFNDYIKVGIKILEETGYEEKAERYIKSLSKRYNFLDLLNHA